MRKIFFSFLLLISSYSFGNDDICPLCDCGANILKDKIPMTNKRYESFKLALRLICERDLLTIVETGTARRGMNGCLRGGCSTLIFAEWIKQNGGEFYSVDISQKNIDVAAEGVELLNCSATFICSDSVVFLKDFGSTIDFLYLDSYDFEKNNPDPSQKHHLNEIIAAYPWLGSNSIVMIDDCDLPYGGKGKLAIEYLLNKGWKILYKGYQVILSQ